MQYITTTILILCYLITRAQNPIIIAHRGASAYEPENTLIAFETAIEMGTAIIETDVHQTKDSVLVLMHDISVDRTTFEKGLIKDFNFNWFSNLKIKQKDHLFKNPSPPSLEDAIKLINGRCKLLIEIKKGNDYYPNIEKHIIELIKKYNAQSWIRTIHSFDKKTLLNVAKLDSNIQLQKLIVFKLPLVSFNFDKHFSKDDFKNWEGVNVYYKFCSKKLIKKVHALGKTVYVWTVNKPRKAKKLAKRGVDGIITNNPNILK